jgi:hypothetical protein
VNFSYTPERLAALERSLTRERLTYYLSECGDDVETALRMYELNTRLSAAFYGPVQGLEVLVRNAMNIELRATFGENWHDLSVIRLQATQADEVARAVRELETDPPTNGAVVAELPFAFWVGLLGPKNENEIWRKALYRSFPNRPKGTERKIIQNALNSIRRLRNRIAHHEKILHRDLAADHATILEIAGWCCRETRDWIASLSTFDKDMLPVAEAELPLEPPADVPVTAANKPKATLNGRPRLGLTPK